MYEHQHEKQVSYILRQMYINYLTFEKDHFLKQSIEFYIYTYMHTSWFQHNRTLTNYSSYKPIIYLSLYITIASNKNLRTDLSAFFQ